MISYRDALSEGMYLLMQEKVPDAGLDARLLLEYVCDSNQNYLYLHGDEPLAEMQEAEYRKLLKRRAGREPLQYIIGKQEFMGYPFAVKEGVLIPRQETEILVELVEQMLLPGMAVLDLCTGSGCILISLLRKFAEHYGDEEKLKGIGVDISGEALSVARQNAEINGVDANFIKADLYGKIAEKFDIIVSNPPYIVKDVIPELMPEVRDFEPVLALDGGTDGLDFYRRIIEEAPEHMKEKAALCVEIGYDQGAAVSDMMRRRGFSQVKIIKDYAELDRIVVGFW